MIGHAVTEAIDHALQEVQAARRDLTLTAFCVRHAEALRRIDRAKARLAYLLQSGTGAHTGLLTSTDQGKLLDFKPLD